MKNRQEMDMSLYSGDIHFNALSNATIIKQKRLLRSWIINTIKSEGYQPGEISYNFCSDKQLLEINKKHLKHNFYTDIITFELNEGKYIIGDIYISIDRVKDNAKTHHATITNELHRVMIHGVLHLCGHKDKTAKDSKAMREKEDYYLSLLAKQAH